jgi:hypothetical protein
LRAVNIGNEKGLVTRLVKKEINDNDEDNPLSVFLYTLKAPETGDSRVPQWKIVSLALLRL